MPKVVKLKPSAPWEEIRATAQDWDAVGKDVLVRMHRHLHLIRAFEETVIELHGEGLVHGPAHSSIGQDAAAGGPSIFHIMIGPRAGIIDRECNRLRNQLREVARRS